MKNTGWMLSLALISSMCVQQIGFAATTFQDASATLDLDGNLTESWGASWGDLNNDGYPDLYMSNHRTYGKMIVNNKDGSFSDVSIAVDPDGVFTGGRANEDTHGASWGDLDNDGDLDMVHAVSTGASHQLSNVDGVLRLQPTVFSETHARHALLFDTDNDGLLNINWIDYGFGYGCTDNGEWGLFTELNNAGGLDFICSDRNALFPGQIITHGAGPAVTTLTPTNRVYDLITGDFNGDLFNDLVEIISTDRPSTAHLVSPTIIETQITSSGTRKTLTFTSSGSITIKDLNLSAWNLYSTDKVHIGATGYNPSTETFTLNANDSANHGIVNGNDDGIYIGFEPTTKVWTFYLSATAWSYVHAVIESSAPITAFSQSPLLDGDTPIRPVYFQGSDNGFQDVSAGSGLTQVLCSSGVSGDFDNDMDLDIYMACREGAANIANVLFDNQGDGTFLKIANASGAAGVQGGAVGDMAGTSDSVVSADYNLDGFLDLFVINGLNMRPHELGGPKQLFKNMGNSNHWLEFDLEGTTSNRDGVGAKVYITTPDGKTQYREQNGGYHRWSQNHQRIHVGLGTNTQADISVEWPSGLKDTFTFIAADNVYTVTERQGLTPFFTPVTPPNISTISVSGTTVREDAGTAIVRITQNIPTTKTVTVGISTASGTATDGADFNGKTRTITFAPGETSKSMGIQIIDDARIETTETLSVRLYSPVGATIGTATGTVSITDNDQTSVSKSTIALSDDFESNLGWAINPLGSDNAKTGNWEIGNPQATSYNGVALQPENAHSPSNALVTAATAGKSAGSEDIDSGVTSARSPAITLPPSGPITLRMSYYFATLDNADKDDFLRVTVQGSVTQTILNVRGNDTNQAGIWKTLQADLSAFAGQTIYVLIEAADNGKSSLVEAGIDDIHIEGLSTTTSAVSASLAGPVTVTEADVVAPIVINLNAISTQPATVAYRTLPGTALAGEDYLATIGEVTFAPGEIEKTVNLALREDKIAEATEAFRVELFDPAGTDIGVAFASITIIDDDIDSDADGYNNDIDAFPYNPREWFDTDGDGVGDNADAFPNNSSEWIDTDGDGVGDNADAFPTDPSRSGSSTDAIVCGDPLLNNQVDRGTFLWKDCDGSNLWHLRVSGGGSSLELNFSGVIETTRGFTLITPVDIENTDILDSLSSPNTLKYLMQVYNNGVDGVDFVLSGSACITPTGPKDLPVLLGSRRSILELENLDLTTLLACTTASDLDSDGLSDVEEANLGTNPNIADTDGGGAKDGVEVAAGLNPLNPADDSADRDADGLSDVQEIVSGTDLSNPDTDGEGLLDGEEVHLYGTNPLLKNTDEDGLSDWVEIQFKGTDPLLPDTDGDGLSDGAEASNAGIGTDPLNPDTDGGGSNDGTEVSNGTDPFNPLDD